LRLPSLPRPFLLPLRQGSEYPRTPAPGWPLDCFRESPRFLQSSGYTGQWFIESPRIFHPSAPPCLNLRVAPFLRSSGNASDRFVLEFPQGSPDFSGPRSSGSAEAQLPGSPRFIALPAAPSAGLQSFPCLLPFGVAVAVRSRVSPCPAPSTAKSMMTPRLDSNFASTACALDESSSQSGLARPCPNLLMHSPCFKLDLSLTRFPQQASNQPSNWLPASSLQASELRSEFP